MRNQLLEKAFIFLISVTVWAIVRYPAVAQVNWHKQVGREVDLWKTGAGNQRQNFRPGIDSSLMEILYLGVRAWQISAYTTFDHNMTEKMSREQIEEQVRPKPDTIIAIDPIEPADCKGKNWDSLFKVGLDSVHKYRILEDWTFDRATGTTDIQITGVAPSIDIITDGVFKGVKPFYWLRYHDILPVLERYGKLYPGGALADFIWDDYFSEGANQVGLPVRNDPRTKTVARVINLEPSPDTIEHHLKYLDMNKDSSLIAILDEAVMSGKLKAYDSIGNKQTIKDLEKSNRMPDTIVVVDPATNEQTEAIESYDRLYGHSSNFKLIEDWTFEPETGHTRITIRGIVLAIEKYNQDKTVNHREDIYWLKFEDVSPIIAQYENQHPDKTLALALWQDYFYSDIKPVEIK